MGIESGGSTKDGFIIKTSACTKFDSKYPLMTKTGTGCQDKWEWTQKFGSSGKDDKALWVAQSSDGTYLIVVGIRENTAGKSKMNIAKLKESDGSIVWEMEYNPTSGKGAGAETVAFTSDGGFVIGGFIDTEDGIADMIFKSSGIVTSGTPFIGKISAADAAGTTAPAAFAWTYTNTAADY